MTADPPDWTPSDHRVLLLAADLIDPDTADDQADDDHQGSTAGSARGQIYG